MAVSTFDRVAPRLTSGLDSFGAALTRGFMERSKIRDARSEREKERNRQERLMAGQIVANSLDLFDPIEKLTGGTRGGTRGGGASDADIERLALKISGDHLKDVKGELVEAQRGQIRESYSDADLDNPAIRKMYTRLATDVDADDLGLHKKLPLSSARVFAAAQLNNSGAGQDMSPELQNVRQRQRQQAMISRRNEIMRDPAFQQYVRDMASARGIREENITFPEMAQVADSILAGEMAPSDASPWRQQEPFGDFGFADQMAGAPERAPAPAGDGFSEKIARDRALMATGELDPAASTFAAFPSEAKAAPGAIAPSILRRRSEMAAAEQAEAQKVSAGKQAVVERFGIDPDQAAAVLQSGDPAAIEELRGQLISIISEFADNDEVNFLLENDIAPEQLLELVIDIAQRGG